MNFGEGTFWRIYFNNYLFILAPKIPFDDRTTTGVSGIRRNPGSRLEGVIPTGGQKPGDQAAPPGGHQANKAYRVGQKTRRQQQGAGNKNQYAFQHGSGRGGGFMGGIVPAGGFLYLALKAEQDRDTLLAYKKGADDRRPDHQKNRKPCPDGRANRNEEIDLHHRDQKEKQKE